MTQTPTAAPLDAATELAAALSPADAGNAREALLAALARARGAGGALAVEIGPGTAQPCALQLLVSARISADAAGVRFDPGPRAQAALGTLTLSNPTGD